MSESAVVEFRNVSKVFDDVVAVEDLSFKVGKGRVVALLGPNGAGKTTALRTLLGLATPSSGEVLLWQKPYSKTTDVSHRVGVVLGGLEATPGATARREVAIWATALGLPKSRIREVLELTGLTYARNRAVADFSTGMKQRLSLAIAMLSEPELLVLDEPANGLDPQGIRWLRTMIRDLAAEGRTILLSSHQLTEVEKTVDDVVVLNRTLRYSGPIIDLTQDGSLEDRFLELANPVAP